MKVFKKITSLLIAVAMVVTLITVSPATTVDAKVKVYTGKKVTLNVGGTDYIDTNAKKPKYTSSNKKIVTVSSKGKLKGKKPGMATIKIKSEKGSAKVTVTVKPKKVSIKSASLTSTYGTSAKITWKKVTGASGYYIYSSTKAKSGFKKVSTVKGGSKTSATITKLKAGETYYFKIKAYAKAGKKTIVSEAYSSTKSVKTWKLVWSDEFNGKTLDMSSWTYETDADDSLGGWGNQEEQHYTAGDNIEFDGKNMIIIPRMEIKSDGSRYITSTRIKSKGKREFTYGKIEIRAKATKGKGSWSAGWMLGNDGTVWPQCGEIDILEAMNGGVPQTIHCPYFNNNANSHGNKTYDTGLTQAQCAADYHTYGIVWTDEYIQFTVDGKNNSYRGGCYNPTLYSSSVFDQTWVFDHPFYFIFNCAVGGNAAGRVSTDGWKLVSDKNGVKTYEDYYYIDYVRVYQ